MTMRVWASAIVSLVGLLVAVLMWSVGQASECSTPLELNWLPGLVPFLVFQLFGTYAIALGDRRQRLAVFIASSVVIAAYVWGLAQSLPSAISTEIACAAQGDRSQP